MLLVGGGCGVGHADGGGCAVERLAFDGSADHEVVAAPAMVGAVAVAAQRAAEVGGGERRDLAGHAQLDGGVVEGGHGVADLAEQRGVVGDQVVVQVKAADRDKKHLSFGAQCAACANQPGHGFELVGQAVASGERRGQGDTGQPGGDRGFSPDGAGGDAVVFVFQRVSARLLHQLGHGVFHGGGVVDVVLHGIDRHRAIAADLVGQRTVARQKHGVAGHVDAGEQRRAVGRQRQVAQVAAPAHSGAFRRRGLPDRLLVVVGKQLGRQRVGAAVRAAELRPCERHHQWPDVELHRRLPGIEKVGQATHGGVQGVLPPARQGRGGGEQRGRQR